MVIIYLAHDICTIMSSYYDIDTILADAQKIPCTFKVDVPGLGYIDGNAGGDVRLADRLLYCTSANGIS